MEQERRYRVIALDMDGTVLNDKKEMTEPTRRAILRALDAGREVVFCSGRSFDEMRDDLAGFEKMHYLIGASGALIYDLQAGRCIHRSLIAPSALEALRDFSNGKDVLKQMFSEGHTYYSRRDILLLNDYGMAAHAQLAPRVSTLVDDVYTDLVDQGKGIEKFNLYHRTPQLRDETRHQVEAMGLPLTLADSEITSLEMSPAGVNKGSGLRELSHLLGIPLEEFIMVGDADNDAGGFAAAGLAIAMGNAPDHIKAQCDVCVADNNHDGCAEAIARYLL